MRHLVRPAAALAACLSFIATTASAQMLQLEQVDVELHVDSGYVVNTSTQREVIFSKVTESPGAPWLRLRFDEALLGEAPVGGEETILRITSLFDGGQQHLAGEQVSQWRHSSAYFNGSMVLVEIIADPGAAPSRVAISRAWAGAIVQSAVDSICGLTDDRILSDDPRVGRAVPVGCTAWIIDDYNHCFLSAGHCIGGSFEIIEFNVPLSDAEGNWQHPGPEDQYAVDDSSMQVSPGITLGNDWAYFGCFDNSETGLTPYEAQGEHFVLQDPPPVSGQSIRITGCGTVSPPVPLEWNLVQKTHVGPYVTADGTLVQYQTDTTGGNSGSPIILEDFGVAIGVHTNGGCDSGGGQNSGTGVNNVGLQYALANPQGVCIPIAPLGFGVVGGLPELLDPAGDSFTVLVWGQEGGIPQPGTGMLHYDLGAGFVAQPMIETNPNVYQANFPALDCPTYVSFYFSAETTEGELVTDPLGAPDDHHEALAAVDVEYAFDDDFETEQGWTVQDSPTLTAGSWDRGAPVGGGDRGDPPTDADGSGQCALTGNQDGDSDVDDGSTTLISPIMDATDPTSVIAYYRWYHNTYGGDPANDIFEVDVSDNGGASWTNLETVGPAGPQVSGGWFHVEFVVADIPGGNFNTDQFRIRFTASDLGGGSVVEAGIDGVQLKRIICGEPPVPGDANGDGVVDVLDLLAVIAAWGQSGVAEDVNGDGIVDVLDLLFVIANWS